MAIQQAELTLPLRQAEAEENEQDQESRLWTITLRKMEDAADEVGRQKICYALHISEGLLSRQLREAEDKKAGAKLLAYLLKHEKSGRLATWLMRDYAGYLPPQRPDRLKPEEFVRQIAAMALGGEFGAAEREKVLTLYAQVERPKEKP